MALESATYISDLNTSNPAAGDSVAQGDDHIRLLKSTIKATFPNVTGAVNPTQTQFNYLASATGTTGTATTNVVFSASPTFTGTVTAAAATLSGLLTVNGQIKFPAAQSASADANTLDDYEEGTFTPTVSFGGAAVGLTYAAQVGKYTKIGNVVYYKLYVQLSAKGSSTGNATVGGLPFAADATANSFAPGAIWVSQMTGISGGPMAYVNPSSSGLLLHYSGTGTATAMADTNFANNTQFMISGCYTV